MDNEKTSKISFDNNDNTLNRELHNSSKYNPSSIYPSGESFLPEPKDTTQEKPATGKNDSTLSFVLSPIALILSIISLLFWINTLVQSFQIQASENKGVIMIAPIILYYIIGGPLFLAWITCYQLSRKGKLKKIANLSLFLKIITIIIVLIVSIKSIS